MAVKAKPRKKKLDSKVLLVRTVSIVLAALLLGSVLLSAALGSLY